MKIHLSVEVKGTQTKVESLNLTRPEDADDEVGYQEDCKKAIELIESWLSGFRASLPLTK